MNELYITKQCLIRIQNDYSYGQLYIMRWNEFWNNRGFHSLYSLEMAVATAIVPFYWKSFSNSDHYKCVSEKP